MSSSTPLAKKTNRWQDLLRMPLEVGRILILVAMLLLLLLFLLGGTTQLYVDSNSVGRDELSRLIPTPHEVWQAWQTYQDDLIETQIPNTLWATLTGLALATVIGLGLASIMDMFPPLRWILYPLLVLTQTIPTFAIAVILILLFGFGYGPKIIVVVLFCFFPIMVSTLDGLRSTNPLHMRLLRAMGANKLQTWWKVRLPTAMPSFFSGLRLAATYSVVGAVIGEYVGSGAGLGKFLQRSYRSFNTDQVFLVVIVIAALTVLLVLLVTLLEMLALRWLLVGRQSSNTIWQKIGGVWLVESLNKRVEAK
ncbi:MAG: ABC transporter permease [Chloroflexi bacterium]|nr:ABC transporter permease [Chloroflexota bacterium]